MTLENKPVPAVNAQRFAGKWYSLTSIPTPLDKNWRETIDIYSLQKDGSYDVLTPYRKAGETKQREIRSKLFQVKGGNGSRMKAQLLWPFKIDYWVIELADDYSYCVVGHPKAKYLFIMSRTPTINPQLLRGIITRCKAMGYATENLQSQDHVGVTQLKSRG